MWKEQNGAARSCTTNRQCPTTHYCTPVTTWTGTVYQTKNLCCPTKNYVCSQPRDIGVRCSSTRITRYYFNVDTKTCQSFEYNGCEGNRNNFASQKTCRNYCLSEGNERRSLRSVDTKETFQLVQRVLSSRRSRTLPDWCSARIREARVACRAVAPTATLATARRCSTRTSAAERRLNFSVSTRLHRKS